MGAQASSTAEEKDKEAPVKKKKSKKKGADTATAVDAAPDSAVPDAIDVGEQPPISDVQAPFDFDLDYRAPQRGDSRNDYRHDFPDEAAMETSWAGGDTAWPCDGKIPLPDFALPEPSLYSGAFGQDSAVDPVCQDVYTCQSIGRPMMAKPDLAPMPTRSEMQDPFYNWRRGGGAERQRVQRQHQHMVDSHDPFAAWRPAPAFSPEDFAPRGALLDAPTGAFPALDAGPLSVDDLAPPEPPPPPLEQLMSGPPPRRENTGQSSSSVRPDGGGGQGSASLLGAARGKQSLRVGSSAKMQQAQAVGSQRPTGMQPSSSGVGSLRPNGAQPTSSGSFNQGQYPSSSRPGSSAAPPSFPMATGGSSSRHITQSQAQDLRVAGSLARAQLAQASRPPKTTVRRPSPPPSGSIAVH